MLFRELSNRLSFLRSSFGYTLAPKVTNRFQSALLGYLVTRSLARFEAHCLAVAPPFPHLRICPLYAAYFTLVLLLLGCSSEV